MDREIAYYLLKLDLRKALIFINKIRRKLNYIINEENYFDGVFFSFRGLKLDSKEEFLIFKSFVAYVVINDLSIEQIFDLEKILKNKMFCEKLLYVNRDFKIGNIYKVEDLEQDSNVFAALLVAKIILVSDSQPWLGLDFL